MRYNLCVLGFLALVCTATRLYSIALWRHRCNWVNLRCTQRYRDWEMGRYTQLRTSDVVMIPRLANYVSEALSNIIQGLQFGTCSWENFTMSNIWTESNQKTDTKEDPNILYRLGKNWRWCLAKVWSGLVLEIGLKLFSFYLCYFSLDYKIFSERKVDFEQENSLNILLIALLSLFHNLYKIYFSFTQIYKSHFDTRRQCYHKHCKTNDYDFAPGFAVTETKKETLLCLWSFANWQQRQFQSINQINAMMCSSFSRSISIIDHWCCLAIALTELCELWGKSKIMLFYIGFPFSKEIKYYGALHCRLINEASECHPFSFLQQLNILFTVFSFWIVNRHLAQILHQRNIAAAD